MYALIAILRSKQPAANDPAMTYLREHIVPNVSAEPGFVAGYWTHDGQRNYNTLVFDNKEAAERRADDVRGNAAGQASFGIIMETVVVAEVLAHAEAAGK
ncbi:hypothetical protein [Nonomuraea sp. 10N515B]|uniref:hypothetical protein n=1 Tax=Nonomuraea sp. 10N515B TaxID=3457422 RepID=UPI003FCD825F